MSCVKLHVVIIFQIFEWYDYNRRRFWEFTMIGDCIHGGVMIVKDENEDEGKLVNEAHAEIEMKSSALSDIS